MQPLNSRREFLGRFGATIAGVAAGQSLALAAGADADAHAFNFNKALGRGVNLGNVLEAPREGEWGLRLEERFFKAIHEAGFDSIRIPIRWSTHASKSAPYAIEPAFLDRVEWAVDQSLSRGLKTIINFHHIEEVYADPEAEQNRFLALWKQVAERFAKRPAGLVFEVLNEPHGKLDDARWQALFPLALRTIRERNPDRMVIIGPAQWNNLSHLEKLALPDDDRRLIATFHYYSPFEFTHQGAEWAEGSQKWLGTTWTATTAQQAALERDLGRAAAWSKAHNRPLFLGEFGAYGKAEMDSRARWTAAVARLAESHGFSWAYWEFGSGFGAYDPMAGRWREPLLKALIPSKPA